MSGVLLKLESIILECTARFVKISQMIGQKLSIIDHRNHKELLIIVKKKKKKTLNVCVGQYDVTNEE